MKAKRNHEALLFTLFAIAAAVAVALVAIR